MDSKRKHFEKHYKKNLKEDYGMPIDPFVKKLGTFLLPDNDASSLDLGCGTGRNAHYLGYEGHNVVGVDFCEKAVQYAWDLAKKDFIPMKKAIHGDISDLEVWTGFGPFNAIISTFVLKYLNQSAFCSVTQQMKKSTIPGGFNLIINETSDLIENLSLARANGFTFTSPDELLNIYSDWDILQSGHVFLGAYGVLAKKPKK